jgi:hypothetical protein
VLPESNDSNDLNHLNHSPAPDAEIERRVKAWYLTADGGLGEEFTRRTLAALHTRRARRARRHVALVRLAASVTLFLAGVASEHLLFRRPAASADPRSIVFVLRAPAAHGVALIGDFNHWDGRATRLVHHDDGTWSATLKLAPGVHSYAYIVDGTTWTIDPLAPQSTSDDFGTPTSTVVVTKEQES